MEKHTKDLAQMRRNYALGQLDENEVQAEPLVQFGAWFEQALQGEVLEPNAMTLATVGGNGRPSTRVVLLKGADERGLVWFTNYASRKGRELVANPYAALQFFWGELERVVRVEGRVEKVGEAESDEYYQSRPLASRIGSWASPQSRVIESREALEASYEAQKAQLGEAPTRPAHWGGYRLVPERWEFWQGRPSRLHDRIVYERGANGVWTLQRLAP